MEWNEMECRGPGEGRRAARSFLINVSIPFV